MITFTIPTWNRAEKLRVCLTSIVSQISKTTENVVISIYNNASDDHTKDVIDEFQKLYPDKVKSKTGNKHLPWTGSFKKAFLMAETEYLWMFGDDDILVDGGLDKVISVIKRKNVDFIHAAEVSRVGNDSKTYFSTLMELSSGLGFIEMTGFISGNIARAKPVHDVLRSKEYAAYSKCSFMQSMILMDAFANSNAAFINDPIIDNQDRSQTKETCERWQKENTQLNYAMIGDGLKVLSRNGKIPTALPVNFFRYLNGNIFEKSMYNFYAHSEATNQNVPKKHIDSLYVMAGMLVENESGKMKNAISDFVKHHRKYVSASIKKDMQKMNLQIAHDRSAMVTYPFNYI